MLVGELARRLDVPYRDVRYLLEQGILPKGAEANPGRGEHRNLDGGQTFWLAIVLKLKAVGLRAPLAGQIAEYALRTVRGIASNASWDPWFSPFMGRFETEFEWFVEVGDAAFIRILTNANPSGGGKLEPFSWQPIGVLGRTVSDVRPIVTVRIDLARIAAMLKG